jgi:Leucine-rich repeat (LRR) protein
MQSDDASSHSKVLRQVRTTSIRYGIWSWRRWVQFRLRAVLLLIVVCSVVFAWARYRLDSYQKQHEAYASISQYANFMATIPGTPSWLWPLADSKTFSDIGHLSFQGQRRYADLEPLSHLPRLYRLSLQNTAVKDEGLKNLSQLHDLNTLSLESTNISDSGLRHLVGLQKLRMLQLSQTKVTRDSVGVLAELRALEILELPHVSLEDDDVRELSRLPRLRKLNFCPQKLTLQGFAYLSEIKSLQEVTFDRPLPRRMELHALPELSTIGLWTDQPLHLSLADLPKLSRLEVNARQIEAFIVRDLPRLELLTLHSGRLDSHVFQQLHQLHELRSVSLFGSRFNASALKHFAHLPRLASLELGQTGLKDEDLQYLTGLKMLDRLDLSDNPIYGRGFVHLVSLPNLKSLDISDSRNRRNKLARPRKSFDLIESPRLDEVFSPQIAFAHLSQVKTLEELILGGIVSTKDEMLLLARLTNLKNIQIDTSRLDESEFAEVSKVLPIVAPARAFRISR